MAEKKTPPASEEEKDVEGHGPYAPAAEPATDREGALDEKEDDVEGHAASPLAKPLARPNDV
jgi:hypothetical protein